MIYRYTPWADRTLYSYDQQWQGVDPVKKTEALLDLSPLMTPGHETGWADSPDHDPTWGFIIKFKQHKRLHTRYSKTRVRQESV